MKRKVNLVGQNTLTVSLPKQWTEKCRIHKGDEIEMETQGSQLVLKTGKIAKQRKKASIDLEKTSRYMIKRQLYEFYRQGVEQIEITFSSDIIKGVKERKDIKVYDYIQSCISRFVGVEIISNTQNKIVIESFITKEEYEKIDLVQNRVFFLLKESLDEFIASMEGDFSRYHDRSYDYHDNVTKFIYYYLRLLNFSDMDEGSKVRLFSLYTTLERMVDMIRYTSYRVSELSKISPVVKQNVTKIFRMYLEMFQIVMRKNFSNDDITNLTEKHFALVKSIYASKMTPDEWKVMVECKIMLNLLNDFTEAYVALHLNEYVRDY